DFFFVTHYLLNSRADIDTAALVPNAKDLARLDAMLAEGFYHAVEASVAISVLLSEHGYLVRRNRFDFNEMFHHHGSFFIVAGSKVEHVAVGRITPQEWRGG